jgi:hypothetical protein
MDQRRGKHATGWQVEPTARAGARAAAVHTLGGARDGAKRARAT